MSLSILEKGEPLVLLIYVFCNRRWFLLKNGIAMPRSCLIKFSQWERMASISQTPREKSRGKVSEDKQMVGRLWRYMPTPKLFINIKIA
ncbi:hypothetical protein DCC62_06005 [candidate division KSB1 bacterium]|nr:MAG: hypothetical protein DCC62_06005 [candidate division KSB1 bacterium]